MHEDIEVEVFDHGLRIRQTGAEEWGAKCDVDDPEDPAGVTLAMMGVTGPGRFRVLREADPDRAPEGGAVEELVRRAIECEWPSTSPRLAHAARAELAETQKRYEDVSRNRDACMRRHNEAQADVAKLLEQLKRAKSSTAAVDRLRQFVDDSGELERECESLRAELAGRGDERVVEVFPAVCSGVANLHSYQDVRLLEGVGPPLTMRCFPAQLIHLGMGDPGRYAISRRPDEPEKEVRPRPWWLKTGVLLCCECESIHSKEQRACNNSLCPAYQTPFGEPRPLTEGEEGEDADPRDE